MLRILPAASGSYQPLQDRFRQDRPGHYDKRLLRIKKLLALAESKNRFEADAAMTKAHELIATHNIELNRLENRRKFISIFIGAPALRHPREDYHLANLLQDYYFITGIWVPTYVVAKSFDNAHCKIGFAESVQFFFAVVSFPLGINVLCNKIIYICSNF